MELPVLEMIPERARLLRVAMSLVGRPRQLREEAEDLVVALYDC